MLYNHFSEHVTDDKKKMYKCGKQWIVASAFILAIGGLGLTKTQSVNAAENVNEKAENTLTSDQENQTKLLSSTKETLSETSDASTPKTNGDTTTSNVASAVSQSQNKTEGQPNGSSQNGAESQSLQTGSTGTAFTVKPQAAITNDVVTKPENQQQTLSVSAPTAVSPKAQYAEQNTANVNVGDGGTFDYVAKSGAWNNVVTASDSKSKTWNGNILFQNIPVLNDKEVAEQNQVPKFDGIPDATTAAGAQYLNKAGLYTQHDDAQAPAWSLTDTVKNDTLSAAQKYEVNQYAMMLTNNYRKALGLDPLVSTADFLALTQKRGDTMLQDTTLYHNYPVINSIFGKYGTWGECLASHNPEWFELMGDRTNNLTMLDVLESVAQGVTNLLNFDGPDQGHRRILLSESVASATGAWSDQKTASGK
ncbi:SEC10/PgrA surface exclusion domain-containing protein [Lacticaseibacillus paracasei]|nr:SEC10/PgrA surface exclusion domain-containing protein [Lacticaseibacillus paracasei]MCT3351852.1 SEC10/PgrA surface exclusion domain-containing protein [Lacticaseibacillus paracasei]VTZ84738.1 hypothetical protein LPCP272_02729 [Lacticaseibacillus paracasei]